MAGVGRCAGAWADRADRADLAPGVSTGPVGSAACSLLPAVQGFAGLAPALVVLLPVAAQTSLAAPGGQAAVAGVHVGAAGEWRRSPVRSADAHRAGSATVPTGRTAGRQ